MKKVLSLLLSVTMLFSITAGLDLTASAVISGDFKYQLRENGTAEITDYTVTATDLSIPSVIDGYDVTSIGYGAIYSDVVTPPSCTAQGYTTHTCTICGDNYVDSYTSPTGHIFNGGKNCVVCGLLNPNYVEPTPNPTPTPQPHPTPQPTPQPAQTQDNTPADTQQGVQSTQSTQDVSATTQQPNTQPISQVTKQPQSHLKQPLKSQSQPQSRS